MIGISVSDILKILDQVPVWKTLTALPKRLRDLEERVAALEAIPAKKASEPCPLCEEPMKITAVARPRNSAMDRSGIQERTLSCTACSHTERRLHNPNEKLGAVKS